MRMGWPGSCCSWPLRRSRTVPLSKVQVQLAQIPLTAAVGWFQPKHFRVLQQAALVVGNAVLMAAGKTKGYLTQVTVGT